MKRFGVLILLTALLLGINQGVNAQDNERGLYQKQIVDKKAIPYPYLREADVLWSKQMWRVIDLREKMNQSLYYPLDESKSGDRKNLFSILMMKIKTGEIEAYSGDDYSMREVITLAEIESVFDAGETTVKTFDLDTGLEKDTTTYRDIENSEVKQFLVKEEWYFDSKLSTMKVRLLGICPIRIAENPETGQLEKKRAFWVFFPTIRETLANFEVYNRNNDAQRISFDDLFMQRRFSSYIMMESNVYDNRAIGSYAVGRAALLESEKIKEWLFTVEHDLWEY
jgi:gliding motility associated protien GldN